MTRRQCNAKLLHASCLACRDTCRNLLTAACLPCSHITRYLGVGTHMEDSSFNKDEEHTRKVLNATYLVQEFIDGGNLRDQVLQQASDHAASRTGRASSCLTGMGCQIMRLS